MNNKTCKECLVSMEAEKFPKNKSNKDGYSNDCKICKNRKNRERHNKKREQERLLAPVSTVAPGHKVCYSCKEEKLISAYGKNKHISGGLENKCKDCRNAYQKELNDKKTIEVPHAPVGFKVCAKCSNTKSHSKFKKSHLSNDGLETKCLSCRTVQKRRRLELKDSKTCTACSNNLPISSFGKDASRGDGRDTRCIQCKRDYHAGYSIKNKDKIKKRQANFFAENREKILAKNKEKYHSDEAFRLKTIRRTTKNSQTFNGRFCKYKTSAKTRGIDFNLSKDQFKTFWQKSCTYCHSKIETVGIDRIDSSKDYSMDNCTPCCSYCNYMKNDLSTETFFSHICKIKQFSEDGILENRKPRIFKTGNAKNDYYRTVDGRFVHYKSEAKKRGIDFNLSKNQFKPFWQKPCSYCGSTIDTIGIDRIDSSKAYRSDNCTPCCAACNSMKNDKPEKDFEDHIALIFANISY